MGSSLVSTELQVIDVIVFPVMTLRLSQLHVSSYLWRVLQGSRDTAIHIRSSVGPLGFKQARNLGVYLEVLAANSDF